MHSLIIAFTAYLGSLKQSPCNNQIWLNNRLWFVFKNSCDGIVFLQPENTSKNSTRIYVPVVYCQQSIGAQTINDLPVEAQAIIVPPCGGTANLSWFVLD